MSDAIAEPSSGGAATQRSFCSIALGGVGACCSAQAVLWSFFAEGLNMVSAAIALHGLAVVAAGVSVRMTGASRSEVQLVMVLTAALPGAGAFAAWWFGASGADRHTANAHAENEGHMSAPRRHEPELQRELRVNSYTRVLRHGSLEEKRNLLRRLAQLGSSRYLTIVRQFLYDAEPELRLCAYAELARIGQRHEGTIGALRESAQNPAEGVQPADALAALASSNRDYAASGVLDEEMAKYWSDQAEQLARRALQSAPDSLAAQRVLALVLADRGEVDAAWQVVARWPEAVSVEAELARAEVAFRRRDRATCRASMAQLEVAAAECPDWLRTMAGAEVAR